MPAPCAPHRACHHPKLAYIHRHTQACAHRSWINMILRMRYPIACVTKAAVSPIALHEISKFYRMWFSRSMYSARERYIHCCEYLSWTIHHPYRTCLCPMTHFSRWYWSSPIMNSITWHMNSLDSSLLLTVKQIAALDLSPASYSALVSFTF